MIQLDGAIRDQRLQSRLLMQVHDELVLEVVPAEKEIMEKLVKETMQNVVLFSVPLLVDVGFGKNWNEAKH